MSELNVPIGLAKSFTQLKEIVVVLERELIAERAAKVISEAEVLAQARAYTDQKVQAEAIAWMQGDIATLQAAEEYANQLIGE